MTQDEFVNHGFRKTDLFSYKEYDAIEAISIDFEEMLIGFSLFEDDDSITWVRCENVQLVINPC